MSQSVDSVPAFFVPNQILFQFTAPGQRFEDAFGPPDDQGISMLPIWLRLELKNRYNLVLAEGSQPVVALLPIVERGPNDVAQQSSVGLAQLKLSKEGAQLPEILELFTKGGISREFIVGDVTLVLSNVSPNWLGGGASDGQTIGTGGPSGPPIDPGMGSPIIRDFAFPVADPILSTKRELGSVDVDVFILDTIPADFERVPARIVDCFTTVDPSLFADLVDITGTPLFSAANPYYDMSDHGLFIAGIIRRIAPNARIHLIRVLNKYGVGTAMTVAAGCAEVIRARGITSTPYVVNCSFTFAVPIEMTFVDEHDKVTVTAHPEINAFLGMWTKEIGTSLLKYAGELFGSILNFNEPKREGSACVAIVAAAGNDTKENDTILSPARYPAALPNVLGVGAMAGSQRALFSNKPDSPETSGLMTLGTTRSVYSSSKIPLLRNGLTVPQSGGVGLVPAVMTDASGAKVADWSGTSFAAPVVAGLLAVLMRDPNFSCADPLAALLPLAPSVESVTKAHVLEATQ